MVDESCKRCYFFAYAGVVPICDYIGITDHTRPCLSGQGCTVKVEGDFPASTQERRRQYQIYGGVAPTQPQEIPPTDGPRQPGRKPVKAATPEEEAKRERQRALRRVRMKKYRDKHKEDILAYQREWYAKNVTKNK